MQLGAAHTRVRKLLRPDCFLEQRSFCKLAQRIFRFHDYQTYSSSYARGEFAKLFEARFL